MTVAAASPSWIGMARLALTLTLAVAVLLATPRTARASDQDPIIAGIVGGVAVYGGLTLTFAVNDVVSRQHSTAYGYTELVINIPLSVGWALAAMMARRPRPELWLPVIAHAALAVHGAHVIASPSAKRTSVVAIPLDGGAGVFAVGRF